MDSRRVHIIESLSLTAGESFPVEQRFIKAFRHVWQRRTQAERDTLIEFWEQQDHGRGIVPLIYLVATLLPRKYDPTESVYGQCDEGAILEFAAPLIENMPDELLETLISHELLHAARRAANLPLDDLAAEEEAVQFANEVRGYDEIALDAWMEENAPS